MINRSAPLGYVIGIVSQKGGVGKSTLSRAIAREAASSDLTVKIADLDLQQGTSVKWNLRRLNRGVDPSISVEAFRSAREALKEKGNHDVLVLDGPARASEATLLIAQSADLIIQPTSSGLDDLEPAVLTFHELVRDGISREKLFFALNRIGTPASERRAREYIGKAGYQILEGALYEKPAYEQAQTDGFSVTETPFKTLNKKADLLIQSLVDQLPNQ
jgi:chromosome partitioning protein